MPPLIRRLLAIAPVLSLFLSPAAAAQAISGSVSGAIVDQTRQVVPGATVTLIDEDNKKVIYQLVGQVEADASHGRISYNSPLGRALIGREVGEEAEVSAPAGDRSYEIKKIEFI